MSDTKFPEDEEQMLELDFGIDTRTYWFEKHKVADWFKRCIEDAGLDILVTNQDGHYWFMKWFGQFMEESE